ncbi:phosphotransferase [Sinorhizobium meliloti]|uniref:phosphotransferase n=1 Tax=Rhizobium meliloti TaxID=382 RepID=UPI00398C901F
MVIKPRAGGADLSSDLPPFIISTDCFSSFPTGNVAESSLLSVAPPGISLEEASHIAKRVFGVSGEIKMLSSERDSNFHIRLAGGEQALLKITNVAEDRDVTAMQTAALAHIAAVNPRLPVQRICQTLSGEPWEMIEGPSRQEHVARLLTFIDGTMLHAATPRSTVYQGIGVLLAQLTKALRGFFHPAAGHALQWDIKHAGRLRPMLESVENSDLRQRLAMLLDRFDAEIAPQLPLLRTQIVHNDFNPHNLVVDGVDASRLTGIIDFGDMAHTPIVCDLAIACSYHITDDAEPLRRAADIVAGYFSVLPLDEEELTLLPDLIRLRHLTTLAITSWRARRYPENASYIMRNAAASLRGLDVIDQIGASTTAQALRAAALSAKQEHVQ